MDRDQLESLVAQRAVDIQSLEDRIRQLEAFIEDLYIVGRMRLSPEWEHRFHQVTRHKHDPAAITSSPTP